MEQKKVCHCCGRNINRKREDYLKIEKEWGYFSKKDLEIHEIRICEECYDAWISTLKIPIHIKEQTEAL